MSSALLRRAVPVMPLFLGDADRGKGCDVPRTDRRAEAFVPGVLT